MTSNEKADKNPLEAEYHLIEKNELWPRLFQQIRQESMSKEYSLDEAKKAENKWLNRYRDVNPYDHTRVILSKAGYTYINASYICVSDARRKYILTQGPLQNTIRHFWLMVWEENSKAIIMLNKLIEKNQSKCSQYWPPSENPSLELPEVDLKVELVSEQDFSHYTVRNIRLTNTLFDDSRDVIQFHYTTWPDFGVPQSPFAFLKFLRDIRQCGAFKSDVGPPIVHCSAGIGRSGTFCLVDSCLVLMNEKGIGNVSVKDVLLEMRTCRMGLIQTADQLRFSYIAIIQGLKVDWDSHGNDGLPRDGVSNGDPNFEDDIVPGNGPNSDSDSEAPPLPPPRFRPENPLPPPPDDRSTESETDVESKSGSSDADNEESSRMKQQSEPVLSNVPVSRKRRHSDAKEKSKRIAEKVDEMKKKQVDAEKWKKLRSMLINLTSGISFVVMSGAIVAYFWYRKTS